MSRVTMFLVDIEACAIDHGDKTFLAIPESRPA
jgi:hypothetical protein